MVKDVSSSERRALSDDATLIALRSALEQTVGSDRYQLWLGPPTEIEITSGQVTLYCGSPAQRQWIERNLRTDIRACVE
ncbi:MAG: hypothetical protein KDA61_05445, partial [Planctomycetales bacterium]|nr:hypothetical protein [Planctomycetales bacterium]